MLPVEALERIAFLLERSLAPPYRVRAFRTAARVLSALPEAEIAHRAAAGTLEALKGVGPKTAQVVREALAGRTPAYLERVEAEQSWPPPGGAGWGSPLFERSRELGGGPCCGVTAICTPTGRTAAAPSRRWRGRPPRWATSGRCSRTTRHA